MHRQPQDIETGVVVQRVGSRRRWFDCGQVVYTTVTKQYICYRSMGGDSVRLGRQP